MKTAVIDIDGVIAQSKSISCSDDYRTCDRVPLVEMIWELAGKVRIVLYTSRREEDRLVTIDWLERNRIPYDALVMEKPLGDFYLDDKGLRFFDWNTSLEAIKMLGYLDD